MLSGETVLPDGFEHWIIKFSARQDAAVAGPMEYAYSLMAKQAGIDMPETQLFETADGQRFFGAKRFDRAIGNQRFHIHTFGNMIHANFRIPCCDYAELMKVALALTKNHAELLRVFRLMVFNVIAHNRDDHAKNFSFILSDTDLGWSFSPAYDISYNDGPGGEHTTTINGEGKNPTKKDILTIAEQFDISCSTANDIIDQAKTALAHWQEFADEAKLPKDAATRYGSNFILL
jgi:serine/threonine-protein kinase HipA